jgi:hypothetical protein
VVQTNKYKLSKSEEKELRQKLAKTLFTMAVIAGSLVILLIFFAPKLGVFFGFFSRHRNEVDPKSIIKPSTPFLANIPKATKEDKVNVSGFAQSGLTVDLYLNGPKSQSTTVAADGQFTFNDVQLLPGTNILYVKAIDQNGVESDTSPNHTVVQDKEKPKITIESPKDEETIKNLDKRIQIKGKLSEKGTLKINDKLAVVRPDLTFDFLLGVTEGKVAIKIEATDDAGNIATETIDVTYSSSQ